LIIIKVVITVYQGNEGVSIDWIECQSTY